MSFYLMLTCKILRFMTLKSQKDLKKHSRIYMTDKQNIDYISNAQCM